MPDISNGHKFPRKSLTCSFPIVLGKGIVCYSFVIEEIFNSSLNVFSFPLVRDLGSKFNCCD